MNSYTCIKKTDGTLLIELNEFLVYLSFFNVEKYNLSIKSYLIEIFSQR